MYYDDYETQISAYVHNANERLFTMNAKTHHKLILKL